MYVQVLWRPSEHSLRCMTHSQISAVEEGGGDASAMSATVVDGDEADSVAAVVEAENGKQ